MRCWGEALSLSPPRPCPHFPGSEVLCGAVRAEHGYRPGCLPSASRVITAVCPQTRGLEQVLKNQVKICV